ncbi:SUMF1/EgtB/PvdO family nonheme iron enzyme [Massilia solisilvae]|uniref:SUMF1/EgtB/PvdO family nonheme iron enzyme n=1 Tax=Massilia solisilvae TaxID=1811225 RepID=A0ABT2BMB5_9BURK|nr:SUMF1/EgtB/PvdO family nonheme iron enzyme [Massilia solisilvae]MCS0609607.1 SUMF1/EgtB/PvdO family nonheme iron enzyme [Massilia solisilvae]
MHSAIQKIRELRTLYEDGLLGKDEFDRRKDAVLDTAYHDERARASSQQAEGTELGLMAGQELGPPARRYRLVRQVARGGMAEVWQALDLATEAQIGHGAEVALKILPPHRAHATHEARLLMEEAIRARRLAHQHVVRVYDWSHDSATGCAFVIMECLDGEDLDGVLARDGRMPLERALALLAPVGEALDYAWERHSLVHRDLKPANLFLGRDGTVKLLDFGIAGGALQASAPASSGTAPYRAPEAGDLQLAPDRALDVHAAAVLLFRMVEGALPFDRNRRPAARPAVLAGAALEVVQAGFAAEPSLRPPSVTDLLRRLRRATAQQVAASALAAETMARQQLAVESAPAVAIPAAPPAASVQEQRREQERRARASAEAEREARKEALRRRLREHLAHEAQERDRIQQNAQRRPSHAAPLSPVAEQMMNSRLAYAATAATPAPGPAVTEAPRPVHQGAATQAARGRLRDRFLDGSSEGPELVVLAPGRFLMGSTEEERHAALELGARKAWVEREAPRHWVSIARPLAMARNPVTVGQWRQFVLGTRWKGGGDVNWAAPGFLQNDEHPVVGVSWQDAQLYVRWLSARTGKRYRLPSEAEWEFACRAGSATPFAFGADIGPDQANYDARFAWSGSARGAPRRGTTPAGSYPPNAWGLCDMHGNVWEWVQDVMHDSYEGAPADGSAWEAGGDQDRRVLRGGSWLYHPRYLRSAVRNGFAARLSNDKVGFRVVREVEQA